MYTGYFFLKLVITLDQPKFSLNYVKFNLGNSKTIYGSENWDLLFSTFANKLFEHFLSNLVYNYNERRTYTEPEDLSY